MSCRGRGGCGASWQGSESSPQADWECSWWVVWGLCGGVVFFGGVAALVGGFVGMAVGVGVGVGAGAGVSVSMSVSKMLICAK